MFLFSSSVALASARCTLNGQEVPCAQLGADIKTFFSTGTGMLVAVAILGFIALCLWMLIFWVKMVIHLVQNPVEHKPLWVLVLFFTGFFGACVYYFSVKKHFVSPENPVAQEQSFVKKHLVAIIVLGVVLFFAGIASAVIKSIPTDSTEQPTSSSLVSDAETSSDSLQAKPFVDKGWGVAMFLPKDWVEIVVKDSDVIASFVPGAACDGDTCAKDAPSLHMGVLMARNTDTFKKYVASQSLDELKEYAAQTDALNEQATFIVDLIKRSYSNYVATDSTDIYLNGHPAKFMTYTYSAGGATRKEVSLLFLYHDRLCWGSGSAKVEEFEKYKQGMKDSLMTFVCVSPQE